VIAKFESIKQSDEPELINPWKVSGTRFEHSEIRGDLNIGRMVAPSLKGVFPVDSRQLACQGVSRLPSYFLGVLTSWKMGHSCV